MMKYILSLILCLWASCTWAFPPGFIGAVTQVTAEGDGGASYTDNFNRAAENPLASPWAVPANLGTNAFLLDGDGSAGNIGGSAEGQAAAYYNNTVNANQYSQITLVGNWGGQQSGPIARVSLTDKTAYVFARTSDTAVKLFKWVAGSYTSINDPCAATVTAGAVMRLEVSGTSPVSLVGKVGGATVCTGTDSTSPIASGYVGVWVQNINESLDNFAGGDL